ncbi:MAG TPA: hypothetical protein VKR58_10410, partial [Aquella sp.]|nr:hypothetical protein [Aquella sp.]
MNIKNLSQIVLTASFLCTGITANADEVEMGSCRFKAPDTTFAKSFNNHAEDEACDEENSCIFTYTLYPGSKLLTNIGNDK